jgi:hypothetical protein
MRHCGVKARACGIRTRRFRHRQLKGYSSGVRFISLMIKAMLSIRIHLALMRFGRVAWPVLCLTLAPSAWAYCADVVLIRSAELPSAEQDELELSTRFYGQDLKTVVVGRKSATSALSIVGQKTTLAVAVEAGALAVINRTALLKALHRSSGSIPLLILGVTPEVEQTVLSNWSGSAIVSAKRLLSATDLDYSVGRVAGLTQQLSGIRIPFSGRDTFYFALTPHGTANEIMAIRNGSQSVPVFIKTFVDQQQVFLLCKTRPSGMSAPARDPNSVVDSFAEVAPVMMFVKYSAGVRGWHTPGHYANFTIDDPWLREPYGELSYKGLLKEMEQHNFHTTIAFIPWNYNRSEANVIALFRDHPDRFSISIHGDNHDHKEFADLQGEDRHAAALKQALARMEKFRLLTHLSYDPVFVFPHGIGPEEVLEKLKTYNYIATVNSTNVPSDRSTPLSPLFALRPETTSFAEFPSIIRYPAAMANPIEYIAINEFLGNPLLFYSHHNFFAKGIDAFDRVADEVNRIEPATEWRGLADIARHLYLIKLRDDSSYDLLALSSNIEIRNTSGQPVVYHVTKREPSAESIKAVTVDGLIVPIQLQRGQLDISVAVPAGAVRGVRIDYDNDLRLSSVSTSSGSARVYCLRMVSDFRDIWLSDFHSGRVLTSLYYRYYFDRYDKYGLAPLLAVGLMLAATCVAGAWTLSERVKQKNRNGAAHVAIVSKEISNAGIGSGRR